ncbi:MAG: Asp-tRNA(Asn)/Glu-tRNA(Gln) amidotransferase subunit GatA [archaeon]|jgi:aspartyl-tRNA(Asn)/glutamyl-tRNA(Gln) amidotransferase subunit A
MLHQKLRDIKAGKPTAEKNIINFLEKIKKENKEYNIVLHLNDKAIAQAQEIDKKIKNKTAGKLAGLAFLVKSNINVKGLITNCASKTLENYRATYNATVIEKLLKEDAIVLGMTNMDEFAAGGSGENSAFGITKNPKAKDRIPGGSSSGSAAGVAAAFCDFALGSDTGGSIRNPASHCGITGFKPSYGAVSRYGLIDLSMSLDQIGPLATSAEDCQIIFDIIKGKDDHDAITRDIESKNKDTKKIKIGVLKFNAQKEIWQTIRKKVEDYCKKHAIKAEELSLNHVDLGIQTYYPIVYVEFFSGTRKFDGRKYGYAIEETGGDEVVRRIMGGKEITKAEFAGKYYRRALKAKKIIEKEFADAFRKYDVIITPTVSRLPHKIGETISVEDMYNYDTLTVLSNLAEIPTISIPAGEVQEGKDLIPVGMQLMAARGNDNLLLEIAKEF